MIAIDAVAFIEWFSANAETASDEECRSKYVALSDEDKQQLRRVNELVRAERS